MEKALSALAEGGALWAVYPKKTSGVRSDLTQDGIREFGIALGLVDYKVCAVDATWTGLCFARRRNKLRSGGGNRYDRVANQQHGSGTWRQLTAIS